MKHRISRRAFLRGCTLLAASAAVGSLTSCGGTNAKDSGLPQLIVGSDTYPPYIYLNNDGVPAGIDVEIATEAFRRMGYTARFEPIDWEQKTALVESGTIDCIWGCFSMDGREEVYRWAGPYMVSRQVAAVDADSSIRTLGDLAGKTIAVQSTGKPEDLFLHHRHPPCEMIVLPDFPGQLRELLIRYRLGRPVAQKHPQQRHTSSDGGGYDLTHVSFLRRHRQLKALPGMLCRLHLIPCIFRRFTFCPGQIAEVKLHL